MLFRYQATLPTLTSGQVGDAQLDVNGRLIIGADVASGTADAGNPFKVAGVVNPTPAQAAAGQRKDLWVTPAGAAVIGGKGISGVDANSNTVILMSATDGSAYSLSVYPARFNGTTWDRSAKANSTSRIPSAAATTNATSAKVTAGTVYAIDVMNTTASVKYLKLYNKASAPTVGTDTPVLTIALPPTNVPKTLPFPNGMYFSTGISYALTGAAADADATALAAGDVVGLNIAYS